MSSEPVHLEDAPTHIAEKAERFYSRYGEINAIEFDFKDGEWILRILFEDSSSLSESPPDKFDGFPVKFAVERFVGHAKRTRRSA